MSKRPGDPGYAPGWCIHYRSPTGSRGEEVTTCEKGVEYSAFANTPFQQRPCYLTENGESKPYSAPCPHLRLPTLKEIADHKEWAAGRMQRLGTVMVGIYDWREKHAGQNFGEVVECPACKGRLHLSITRGNGHVHGECETPGCVKFME